jgi:hypothetical protein
MWAIVTNSGPVVMREVLVSVLVEAELNVQWGHSACSPHASLSALEGREGVWMKSPRHL